MALATPLSPCGSTVDVDAYRSLLRWHVEQGTDGLCVLGTTGEASTLTRDERMQVLEATREELGGLEGGPSIIVGSGTISTEATVEMSKASSPFCDALLVVSPYYVKPPLPGLISHFKAVVSATDKDIVLYNVPGRTGRDMLPSEIAAIKSAVGPRCVGVKEATGDVSRLPAIKALCGDDFLCWSGDDGTGKDFNLMGGDGVISVTANVAPAKMAEMMRLCFTGDEAGADAADAQLRMLHDRLFCMSNPVPVKYALARMGRAERGIRSPLSWMEEEYEEAVDEALRGAGCI